MTQDGAGSIHALRDESDPWSVFDPLCTSACTIARIDSSALTFVIARLRRRIRRDPRLRARRLGVAGRARRADRRRPSGWVHRLRGPARSVRVTPSARRTRQASARASPAPWWKPEVGRRDGTHRAQVRTRRASQPEELSVEARIERAQITLATSLSGAQKLRGPERSRASRRRSAVNPIRARIERIAPTGTTYLNRAIQTTIAHGTAPQASEYGAGVPVEYQLAAIAQAVTSPGTERASQAAATRPSHLLRLTPVSLPRGDVRTRQPN